MAYTSNGPVEAYNSLLTVAVGAGIQIHVDDFENTRFPKTSNPRIISGDVERVKEDVSHSAGEIQRSVVIGDPWGDGCIVDCGDTGENQMVSGSSSRVYLKAWRPRAGKDRVLLGRVTGVERDD